MEKFDIYWYNFIYEDDKSQSKTRPVLVLDDDVLLPIAKITSSNSRGGKDYQIKGCTSAGLKKSSIVRFDKVLLVTRSTLTSDKYIGHLSEEDIEEIKKLKLVESLDERSEVDGKSKETSMSELVNDFIEDIYDLRKSSIAQEGEYGLGNLVFKEFRNLGYLDNLKDLKNELKSKELSLESLNRLSESINNGDVLTIESLKQLIESKI